MLRERYSTMTRAVALQSCAATVTKTKPVPVNGKKRRLPQPPSATGKERDNARPTKRARVIKDVQPAADVEEDKSVAQYLIPLPTLPSTTRPPLHLFVWGASDSGQLGLGEEHTAEVSRPKKHPWVERQMSSGTFGTGPDAGIVSVVSGGLHTFILDSTGKIWSCGTNDEAALGRNVKKNPEDNESLVKAQDFGVVQSLVDEEFRAVKITAGDNFGAALNEKGDLKLWGTFRQDDGTPMFSPTVAHQWLPTSVLNLGQRKKAGSYEKVASIAAGENHVLVLTTHGDVYSWGIGDSGQLGRKILPRHKSDAVVPRKVVLGSKKSRRAVVIGAGLRASFAVDEQGDVWGWGSNSRGQIGNEEEGDVVYRPTKVIGLPSGDSDRVVQICGGEWHTLFLTTSGKVYACGAGTDSQLGLPNDDEVYRGDKNASSVPQPVLVPIPTTPDGEEDPVVQISSGPRYNMAVTKAGAMFAWGLGLQSELGISADTDTAETPQMIVRRDGGWHVDKVSCGGQHAMGLFRKREKES